MTARREYMQAYYEDNKERLNEIKRERRERARAEREINKSRLKLNDWLKKKSSDAMTHYLDKIALDAYSLRYDISFQVLRDEFMKLKALSIVKCDFHQLDSNMVEKMKYLDYLMTNKIGNETVLADIQTYFKK